MEKLIANSPLAPIDRENISLFFFRCAPAILFLQYAVVINRREKEENECNKMKADDSSSYSSSSLLKIMIPQFQQLLPLETNLSGSWLNTHFQPDSLLTTANKLLSPPISITPTSICTDLSDSEYQAVDLSTTRKYSPSSPPLSNINSELLDCSSSHSKSDSIMAPSHHEKKSRSTVKSIKQCSNFSIEHILSSSFRSPTYEFLAIRYRHIQSIFSKRKTRHLSDRSLHRIIRHRKRRKSGQVSCKSQSSRQPQGIFLRYVFDFYNDLIHRSNQISKPDNFCTIDALEQLAEIACKLDVRQKRSLLNENTLTVANYDSLLTQSQVVMRHIYRKYQRRTLLKRLDKHAKVITKKNVLLPESSLTHCPILLSDIEKKDTNRQPVESICFHLRPNEITANLDILLPNNGLLYEATIQPVSNYDDLLLVRLHHERQTYLIPIHDLCRLACPKMVPEDLSSLSKGLRVCAYWSTSLRGLHPAIVDKIPSEVKESSMVGLLFDDGDTGLIKLNEIRLLPDDYNGTGINLEEWRVSSFQLSGSTRSSRRTTCRVPSNGSTSTTGSVKRLRKEKISPIVVPPWTMNSRNSILRRYDSKETIRIGDCIVLHGMDKSLSYIGKVLKFYHDKSSEQDLVRIQWYYSPQETPRGVRKNDLPGALYESTHIDQNPIAAIRCKGTIYESYDDYAKTTNHGKRRKESDFYLVGHYDPTTGALQRYDKK